MQGRGSKSDEGEREPLEDAREAETPHVRRGEDRDLRDAPLALRDIQRPDGVSGPDRGAEARREFQTVGRRGAALRDDGEGLSAAFNESLGAVTVSQDYLNSYAAAMIAVGANEQLVTDLETVKTKLAEDPTIAAEDEAAEDGGDETAAAEEPDLNTFIDSLIEQAAAQ